MKRLIKYAAVIFALMLSASIIGGCLTAGVAIVQEIIEETGGVMPGRDGQGIWYRTEDGDVVFLGIRFGSSKGKSGSETFTNAEITSMKIEVGNGELVVEVWDNNSISVEYENIPEEYEIYNDKGVLVIKKDDILFALGAAFTETPKIHISVPAGMSFKEVEVDKGSGSAKIIGVATGVLIVENGSGGVNISDTSAEKSVLSSGSGSFIVQDSSLGEASMDAGSGFVNFENIVAENFVLDTGSGRADVSGVLTGNCVFESGSGSMNVVVYGEMEAYNFRADMGSGGFYLNGRKEDGSEVNVKHSNAEHLLMFEAGSGRVSLKFDETKQ